MQTVFAEKPSFVDVFSSGADEKYSDVYPVGRLSYNAVVGVKNYRNQKDSEKYSSLFDAHEVFFFTEKETLENSIDKSREKEQFHMLPRGFVHRRKRRNPYSAVEPIV